MRPCGVLIKFDTALQLHNILVSLVLPKVESLDRLDILLKENSLVLLNWSLKCVFLSCGVMQMASLKRKYVWNGPTLKTQSLPMVYWDHIKPTKKHCCTHMVKDACFFGEELFRPIFNLPSHSLPLWYSCLNAIQIVAPTTKSSKSDNMSNKISRLPHLSQFQRKFIQIETFSRVKFRKKCSGLQLHARRQAFAVLILISRMISCCDLAQK